jgi:RES domain-containing protein
VYRALKPVWVRDPLSGEGARRYGGRFNPKGMAALHCTLDPVTALREISQIGQPP